VDILDPILGNKYETTPEKLHAWERASRVERDPKRGKKPNGNGDGPLDVVNGTERSEPKRSGDGRTESPYLMRQMDRSEATCPKGATGGEHQM